MNIKQKQLNEATVILYEESFTDENHKVIGYINVKSYDHFIATYKKNYSRFSYFEDAKNWLIKEYKNRDIF